MTQQICLTHQNAQVPALGLGTWQLEGEKCAHAVAEAIAMGYRHIDTAQIYGNEAEVGTGLKNSGTPRHNLWLTTKVWRDQLAHATLPKSVDESLEKLQTDYVDLLLIHWPNPDIPLEETLDALLAVQAAGKTRHIGVSNFPLALMEAAWRYTDGKIITNQVEYHPYLNQSTLLAGCAGHDMFLTAYSPLARGRVKDDAAIQAIAATHNRTPAQVTLRWLLQQQVCAIPKASSAAHLAANLAALDFELSARNMADITALLGTKRLVSPAFAPAWDAV